MGDLARFEWVYKEVFHKPTHVRLSEEYFQEQHLSGSVRFAFASSVQLFRSPYSVYEIWKLRGTPQEALSEECWKTPQWLLCYKHAQQVYVKHLKESEYALLVHLVSGLNVEEAIESTLEQFPALPPETVSHVFSLIRLTGIVTDVRPSLVS